MEKEECHDSTRSQVSNRRSLESLGLQCFDTLLPSCSLQESRLLLTQLFKSTIYSRKPSLLYFSLYIINFSLICSGLQCVCCIHVSCNCYCIVRFVCLIVIVFFKFLHFVWLARKSINFFFFYKFWIWDYFN